MTKLRVILYIAFLLVLNLLPFASSALAPVNVILSCENTNVNRGDTIHIKAAVSSEQPINMSAFRMKLGFEHDKLSFKTLTCCKCFFQSDISKKSSKGSINVIYSSSTGINISKDLKTELFDIEFKVNKSASFGQSDISAEFDGVCDTNFCPISVNFVNPVSINIYSQETNFKNQQSNCLLRSLCSSKGSLNPAFNPHITQYTVSVPYDLSEIDLTADPLNNEALINVNRRKLNAAGKSTLIKITVSNKKSKLIYAITVNREEKPSLPNNILDTNPQFPKSSKTNNKLQGPQKNSNIPYLDQNNIYPDIYNSELGEKDIDQSSQEDNTQPVYPNSQSLHNINNSFKHDKNILKKKSRIKVFLVCILSGLIILITFYSILKIYRGYFEIIIISGIKMEKEKRKFWINIKKFLIFLKPTN